MAKQLDLVKFNLTQTMTKELINFNEIKKKIINIKKQKKLSSSDFEKIQELEKELNDARVRFIKEFRSNNKEEINEYLDIKEGKL